MGKTFAASCKRYVVFRNSKIFAENKPPAAHFIFQTFVVTDPIMRAQLPRPRLQTLNLRFWTRVVISPRLELTYRCKGGAGREYCHHHHYHRSHQRYCFYSICANYFGSIYLCYFTLSVLVVRSTIVLKPWICELCELFFFCS